MKPDAYLKMLQDYHVPDIKEDIDPELLLESKEYLEEGAIASHLSIFLFGQPAWTLWRAIQAAFSKAHKKCGTFEISDKRDICIIEERIKECKKKIKFFNSRMKDIKKKRDPKKAKKSGDKLIKEYERRKKDYEKRLKKLEEQYKKKK